MTTPDTLDIPVRPETKALAAQAGEIHWRHLWSALSKPLRAAMVEHFLSAVPAERSRRRRWFAQGITAEGAGFTPASLLGRSDADMAKQAARIMTFRDDLVGAVVTAYFTRAHLDPQRALFGAVGIALDADGQPERSWEGTNPEDTARGIEAVLAGDRDRSWIFLIAVAIGWANQWPGLVEILRRRAPNGDPVQAPAGDHLAPEFAVAPAAEGVETPVSELSPRLRLRAEPHLTMLDDLLTKTILATEAGNAHALTREELAHLLDEVKRMDTERRRTFFHFGFTDGLFGQAWQETLGKISEERAAWYAAGYLTARRRTANAATLLEHWEHPNVQLLVSRTWPPLAIISETVLEILVEGRRDDALARHASVLLDTNPLSTLRAALTIGSRCLDEGQPDRAYSVLAPAADWVALREAAPARPHWTEERMERESEILRVGYQVRRRFAHSCRLSGRRQEAEQELRALCARDVIEPEIRAMLLADLGLLEAGYQELADLTIPDLTSGFPDAVAQLSRGRTEFDEAVRLSPSGAAHARYALGILASVEEDWSTAATQLGSALRAFESRPGDYEVRGLLTRARGFEAVATIINLENTESCRAAEHRLQTALTDGFRMPRSLTNDVAQALVTADAAIGAPFLAQLFERKFLPPEEIATLLADSPPEVRRTLVGICATLTDLESLSLQIRTRLAYKALESDDGSLPDGLRGDLKALIEDAACDGVHLQDFLTFVSAYQPGWGRWSRSDAAMAGASACLANGRLEEAQEFARQAFNRLLTHQDHTAEHDPEGALELMRMAGASTDELDTLTTRLGSASAAPTEAPALAPQSKIHILIVGGDETQAQYEAAIKAEVAERYAGAVTIHMHPTGMGSNWNKHLDAVGRLLPATDGVVISSYVRTMFGRTLRANLGGKPWRTCTTKGKSGFLRLVDDLVREIDSHWRTPLRDGN